MMYPAIQLNLLQFPSLLGPLVLISGIWILLAWYIEHHIVPALPFDWIPAPAIRAPIIVLAVSGLTLASLGFLLYIERLWLGVLFVHAIGRMIEAGAAVYGLRKIWAILHKLLTYLRRQTSGTGGSLTRIARRLLLRLKYNLHVGFLLTIFTSLIFILSFWIAGNPLVLSLRYAAGVFVGITVSTTLLWHIRKIFPRFEPVAGYGVLLCIAGAELYAYPSNTFPLAGIIPGIDEQTLLTIDSAIPLYTLWDATTAIVGQLAFVFGLLFSVLFLIMDDPMQQDTSDTSGASSESSTTP